MNIQDLDARTLSTNPWGNNLESAGCSTDAKQAEYAVTHNIIAMFENKVYGHTFADPILASLAILAVRRVP